MSWPFIKHSQPPRVLSQKRHHPALFSHQTKILQLIVYIKPTAAFIKGFSFFSSIFCERRTESEIYCRPSNTHSEGLEVGSLALPCWIFCQQTLSFSLFPNLITAGSETRHSAFLSKQISVIAPIERSRWRSVIFT